MFRLGPAFRLAESDASIRSDSVSSLLLWFTFFSSLEEVCNRKPESTEELTLLTNLPLNIFLNTAV